MLSDRPPNEFGGFCKVVFLYRSNRGFKRHGYCLENVKNKSLTMPKHKGRYPAPAPKCLYEHFDVLREAKNLFTFSWDTT